MLKVGIPKTYETTGNNLFKTTILSIHLNIPLINAPNNDKATNLYTNSAAVLLNIHYLSASGGCRCTTFKPPS